MKILVYVFLIIPTILFAQIKYQKNRIYGDSLPVSYNLNISELRNNIYSRIPSNLKNEKNNRMCYFFADNEACDIAQYISSGEIYSDWDELENYLNDILKKVIPKELEKDSLIHVYIAEDGTYNAFMATSGHIFVNIGIFSDVYNEATIAGIFAHELAHYYLKHSVLEFIEEKKGGFVRRIFNEKKILEGFSRKFENEADSLAIIWLNNSGYNINGLLFSFQTIDRIENNYLKQLENKNKLEVTTHPLAKDRLANLNIFLEKNKSNEGSNFLTDENKFFKLREELKPEILRYLFEDFEYADCLELAFKFHLFDPNNVIFINYIMECIRRECYLDSKKWNSLFIVDRYFETYESNGIQLKREMTDHLFKKFNLDILYMDVRVASQIQAKFYWKDEPKFTTYEEAFEFFFRLSKALNEHECILSKALSCTENIAKRDSLLKEYLTFNDIEYKNYAENLLNGTIINNLKNKKLFVFSSLDAFIKVKDEEIQVRNNVSYSYADILQIVDSISNKLNDRNPLVLPILNHNNLNEFKELKNLELFSMTRTVSKGEKTELFILEPRFWDIFLKYNVNEIEFINSIYTDNENCDDKIEIYTKLMDTDFNTLFNRSNSTKYLDTFISSVRIITGKMMKIKYYSGSNSLKFKSSANTEIVKEIKTQLINKEKYAEKLDHYYRQL